jgi:xanthine dehydrogenase molybdenum-binding subunit
LLRGRHDGFDGLLVIKPDGRICFQSGIGNLGTESVLDVHRVGAEILGAPWEKCDVNWGNTANNLPWTCVSGGSQTTHAMTRAAYAVAMEPGRNSRKSRPRSLGGKPEDYEVANERVFRKGGGGHDPGAGRSARDSTGRHYDGHECAGI